jgi:hypothetical protein
MAAAGASGVVLGGCGLFDHEAAPPLATDPLEPLLTEAVALAAAYDRVVAAQPGLAGRLTPLAGDHRAHATELAELIGRPVPSAPALPASAQSGAAPSGPAPSGPAPSGPAPSAAEALRDLRAAEQIAQRNAVSACTQAPAGRAALIGSIAACRATHAEALW